MVKKTVETLYNFGGTITTITKKYIYLDKKLYKIVTDNSSENLDNGYEVFTYSDDLIIKVEKFDLNNTLVDLQEFIYDEKNQLIERRNATGAITGYYFYYNPETANFTCGTYIDSKGMFFLNGNLIRRTLIATCMGGLGSHTTYRDLEMSYTYDSKNNPYKNIIGFDKLLVIASSESLSFNQSGVNNVITESRRITCDLTGFHNEYSYNQLNFPIVKKKYQEAIYNGLPENILVRKIDYFY